MSTTPAERKKRGRRFRSRLTRDTLIFTVGLVGILNEEFFREEERPYLLLLFGAMIGLPAFLNGPWSRNGDDNNG